MKLTKLFPIAFLFFGFITSKSFSSTDTVLIMTGYGATEQEATQSAIQNAIETSKGILLLSTSNITNNELKSDEITTSYEGYSYKHQKISAIKRANLGGMIEVKAKVWVSIDQSRILSTSNKCMDSLNVYLESMNTKKERIAEAINFIFKWIEAHDNEYGYTISSISESTTDDYNSDITYKPITNPVFISTITKLIDRLNGFSHTKYTLSLRFFRTVGGIQGPSINVSSNGVVYDNYKAVTLQSDLSYGQMPALVTTIALCGNGVQPIVKTRS